MNLFHNLKQDEEAGDTEELSDEEKNYAFNSSVLAEVVFESAVQIYVVFMNQFSVVTFLFSVGTVVYTIYPLLYRMWWAGGITAGLKLSVYEAPVRQADDESAVSSHQNRTISIDVDGGRFKPKVKAEAWSHKNSIPVASEVEMEQQQAPQTLNEFLIQSGIKEEFHQAFIDFGLRGIDDLLNVDQEDLVEMGLPRLQQKLFNKAMAKQRATSYSL